jgi:hypothetical protein
MLCSTGRQSRQQHKTEGPAEVAYGLRFGTIFFKGAFGGRFL